MALVVLLAFFSLGGCPHAPPTVQLTCPRQAQRGDVVRIDVKQPDCKAEQTVTVQLGCPCFRGTSAAHVVLDASCMGSFELDTTSAPSPLDLPGHPGCTISIAARDGGSPEAGVATDAAPDGDNGLCTTSPTAVLGFNSNGVAFPQAGGVYQIPRTTNGVPTAITADARASTVSGLPAIATNRGYSWMGACFGVPTGWVLTDHLDNIASNIGLADNTPCTVGLTLRDCGKMSSAEATFVFTP